MHMHATLSAQPSSLYVRQICPGVEYQVLGEFEKSWRGFGILAQPLRRPPNVAAYVNAEVQRLNGDAASDVLVRSDLRAIIYAFFFPDLYPRYDVRGKVIRYKNGTCEVGEGFR